MRKCYFCEQHRELTDFPSPRAYRCSLCRDVRKCLDCKSIKPVSDFYSTYGKKCQDCLKVIRRERHRKWHKENFEKIKAIRQTEAGKERKRKQDKQYYAQNKEKILARNYAQRARREYKDKRNEKQRDRTKLDPTYRLNKNIRRSIYTSLFRQKGGRHWEDLVGYKLEDLKSHLESKFVDGMNWGNYGEWVIDHITPMASFDIKDFICDDFKKCWALDNLQPLWALDNAKKSKYDLILVRQKRSQSTDKVAVHAG